MNKKRKLVQHIDESEPEEEDMDFYNAICLDD
jgi:hypothetical protein